MKSNKIIKDSSALGQFGSAIAQICEEKGIDKERVVETVEAALAAAYKKDYGKKGQIIVAKMDEKTGEVEFKQLKEVVDESTRTIEPEVLEKMAMEIPKKAKKSDEEIEKPKMEIIDPETQEAMLPRFNPERDILVEDAKKVDKALGVGDFLEISLETKDQYGRVASQTAKQVIIQRIREAERDAMYDEYKSKEGEVVNGIVQRIEGKTVFVDLGKSVGALFPSEQIPGENYRIGQRLKVYLEKVESDPKGPGITLSRSHATLLKKLFELEVPEIFAGTVEIKSIAREAGNRSKIAVFSNEEGIDPIGSCVGQKGTRVQAVIDEIGGEKIDIIEWNDDAAKLIGSSLSPAKVVKVELDESKKEATVYVPKDQLSLAIGKRGQNVRLAAKLTGWRIDVEAIGGEEEKPEEKTEEKIDKNSPVEKAEDGKEDAEEEAIEEKAEKKSGKDDEKEEKEDK